MCTIIERLADFAIGLSWDAIPPRVLRKARWQLLSTLAAIHASARHELGALAVGAVQDLAGDGPCSLIPSGRKVDPLSAVYGAAALSLALDYDDYLLFGHSGHSAVCAPLLVGQALGRSLREVLVAQVAANEIAGRLGASVLIGPHNGQAWSHIHLASAAAATGRLLRLTASQTAHALAIAMYQPNYVLWPGFMGPDSKLTTAASPTVGGVRAAYLAARGATGALDLIECRGGFLERFSYAPLPGFFSGLGTAWTTDTLAFKPWPGCAYVDSTVDAVAAISDRLRSDSEHPACELESIDVAASLLTVQMDALSRASEHFDPLSPVSLNFSIPGNAALTWLSGRLDASELRKESLRQRAHEILPVAARVRLRHDPAHTLDMLLAFDRVLDLRSILAQVPFGTLARAVTRMRREHPPPASSPWWGASAGAWARALRPWWSRPRPAASRDRGFDLGRCDLSQLEMPFGASVAVHLRDGRVLGHTQRIPRGAPGRPERETHDLVLDKWAREAAPALGAQVAGRVVDMVFDDAVDAAEVVGAACAS